jgi:hypothetical protein
MAAHKITNALILLLLFVFSLGLPIPLIHCGAMDPGDLGFYAEIAWLGSVLLAPRSRAWSCQGL